MIPVPTFNRRQDILLLILSSIGILGFLIRSGTLIVIGILTFNKGNTSSLASNVTGAFGMIFCAGMLLPVLVNTLKHLKGMEILPVAIKPIKFWQGSVLFSLWILVVVIGTGFVNKLAYGWALAIPLYLLGISLPIISLVWIGIGGLPSGSHRRLWSVFGFGMVGGTMAALLLEYLLFGIGLVVIGVLAIANPEIQTAIEKIKDQVAILNGGDIQALMVVLAPTITNPIVILSILVFTAVLTPLIEEAVKPAVIWFLGNHLKSPIEGFTMGALCGAGFALLEGFIASSGSTELWGFGLTGRAAASLMHITSSGLVGWSIASAQLEKRYWRLVLTYLLAVSIHGLWNGSAIMAVYGSLRIMLQNMQMDLLSVLFAMGGIGMLTLLILLLLTTLPLINRHLRQSIASNSGKVQSDIIAQPATSNSRETNGLDA